jgi:hypothetical protein
MLYNYRMSIRGASRYVALASAAFVGGVILSYTFSAMAAIAGYPVGQLYQSGIPSISSKESNPGWQSNAFSCDSGYSLQGYHYSQNSSNNATWYACN